MLSPASLAAGKALEVEVLSWYLSYIARLFELAIVEFSQLLYMHGESWLILRILGLVKPKETASIQLQAVMAYSRRSSVPTYKK